MSSYRFCRTDDIGLLVDALNQCWAPHFPGEPLMTPDAFKRLIRDLQVWCSSCMVAFADSDPIAVLIGAKRPQATLVYRMAVHPDHCRQGHGRHLLESLGSKLAILGPPRIVAEVPESLEPARNLFRSSGYVDETVLTDYVLEDRVETAPDIPGRFVIPVSVDDLAANGLLPGSAAAMCWERSSETLTARKERISGLAVASEERIEAYLIYMRGGEGGTGAEIVGLWSAVDDRGAALRHLLRRLLDQEEGHVRWPKVHSSEMSASCAEAIGFRPAARYRVYGAMAPSTRSESSARSGQTGKHQERM